MFQAFKADSEQENGTEDDTKRTKLERAEADKPFFDQDE
jgi:hypothetical protein